MASAGACAGVKQVVFTDETLVSEAEGILDANRCVVGQRWGLRGGPDPPWVPI